MPRLHNTRLPKTGNPPLHAPRSQASFRHTLHRKRRRYSHGRTLVGPQRRRGTRHEGVWTSPGPAQFQHGQESDIRCPSTHEGRIGYDRSKPETCRRAGPRTQALKHGALPFSAHWSLQPFARLGCAPPRQAPRPIGWSPGFSSNLARARIPADDGSGLAASRHFQRAHRHLAGERNLPPTGVC